MNYTLDDWWCHLTISEKERIAGKLFQEDTDYPNCTNHWLSLKDDQKLEKARVFDPFEHAGLTPLGEIRLTLGSVSLSVSEASSLKPVDLR